MKNRAAILVFLVTGMLISGQCITFHVHGWLGWLPPFLGAVVVTCLTRPFWLRLDQPLKRPPRTFDDPTLGNRAKRRAAQKQHRHR